MLHNRPLILGYCYVTVSKYRDYRTQEQLSDRFARTGRFNATQMHVLAYRERVGQLTTQTIATNGANIRVLIAGRRTAFLDGVTSLLETSEGMEVMGGVEEVH